MGSKQVLGTKTFGKKMNMKSRIKMLLWLAVTLLAACTFLAVLVVTQYLISIPGAGTDLAGKLSKTQEKTIDLTIDLTKTLITWGFAVIGAFIYFLKRKLETAVKFTVAENVPFIIGVASAASSLFFGYVVIESITNSLSHNVFQLRDPSISIPGIIQFFMLIVAIMSLVAQLVLEENRCCTSVEKENQ